jgi:hypothetical protein
MSLRVLLVVVLIALATVESRRGSVLKTRTKARSRAHLTRQKCLDYKEEIAYEDPRDGVKDLVCIDFDGTITLTYSTKEEWVQKTLDGTKEEEVAVLREGIAKMRETAYVGIVSNGVTSVIEQYLATWKIKVDFVSGNAFFSDPAKKVTRIKCIYDYYGGKFNHLMLIDDDGKNLVALKGGEATFTPTAVETFKITEGATSFLHSVEGPNTMKAVLAKVSEEWVITEEDLEAPTSKGGLSIVIPDNPEPDIIIIPEEKFCCCNADGKAVERSYPDIVSAERECVGNDVFVVQLASAEQSCRRECPGLVAGKFKWCCCGTEGDKRGKALGQAYETRAAVTEVCGLPNKIMALHATQSCRHECPKAI